MDSAVILRHRKDPELKCPNFCQILWLDPAGEWSRGSPDFMQKMIDNDIDVRQLPTNVDKRGLGKGEMAVQITKTQSGTGNRNLYRCGTGRPT